MKDREFRNIYADQDYAASYAGLEWGGTYYLVLRELPRILERHVAGRRALDFGCGTGRSTRLLRSLGFEVTGIDISEPMIESARRLDPSGDYRICSPADFTDSPSGGFDLILAAFPFDNIPADQKKALLLALRSLMAPAGRLINIVSSPEIYFNEWASFSTAAYAENKHAKNGEIVRIVTREFKSGKPAEDILCTPEAYRAIYEECGLELLAEERPLGRDNEPVAWVNEKSIAPWIIYVLAKKS